MQRRPTAAVLALSVAVALVGAACTEEEETGAGEVTDSEVVSNITLTPADNAPFGLAEGMYRIEWSSTCPKVSVTITGDTGYTKTKSSSIATFSAILTSVPAGTYQVQQTEADCADWAISVTKI